MKNEKPKHTPGPWHAEGELICAPEKDGRIIADIRRRDKFPEKEQKANARLIAAAPELLAALESIKAALEDGAALTEEGLEDMHAIARAAIAKAKGGR